MSGLPVSVSVSAIDRDRETDREQALPLSGVSPVPVSLSGLSPFGSARTGNNLISISGTG